MFETNNSGLTGAFRRYFADWGFVSLAPAQGAGAPREPWGLAGLRRWAGIALSSLILSACVNLEVVENEPSQKTGNGNIDGPEDLDDIKDSGPSEPVDVTQIPDAVPRAELRTRAGNTTPYTVLGKTYRVLGDSRGYRQRGVASWYGKKFHGRPTANGERYDMFGMTAAHKSLPIPSYVEVTNLENGRSVVVRVNDRGPFHGGRLIDLSYTAAAKLGIVEQGTAEVEVAAVDPAVSARALVGQFLQAGAFGSEASALALKDRIAGWTTYPVTINRKTDADSLYRVRIGPIADNSDLVKLRTLLQEKKLDEPYVVRD